MKLNSESFVFDLAEVPKINLNPDLFTIKIINDTTISVSADKDVNLNSIFDYFSENKIEIISMRNETNRLEELFLELTNNGN